MKNVQSKLEKYILILFPFLFLFLICSSMTYATDLLEEGKKLYEQSNFEEAYQFFENVTNDNPENWEAWMYKGLTLRRINKYQEMRLYKEELKCYENVTRYNPQYAAGWNNKGHILNILGKYEEAIKCFDKAININLLNNNKDPDPYTNKGRALMNSNKNEEALKAYDMAIQIDPGYSDTYYYMGILYLINFQDNINAEKYFFKALKIKPDFLNCLNALAVADYYLKIQNSSIKPSNNDLAKTFSYIEKALTYPTMNPTVKSPIHITKGTLLLLEKHVPEALKEFDDAIECNPTNSFAYNNKGVALIYNENIEDAVETFKQGINLDENKFKGFLYYNMGVAYTLLKKYDAANEAFKNADVFNKSLEVLKYYRAKMLEGLGEFNEAIKLYESRPKQIDYITALASLYNKLGNNEKARDLLKGSKSYKSYITLGQIELEDANYFKAIDNYNKAIELNPERNAILAMRAYSKFKLVQSKSSLKDAERDKYLNGSIIDLQKSNLLNIKNNYNLQLYYYYLTGVCYYYLENYDATKESLKRYNDVYRKLDKKSQYKLINDKTKVDKLLDYIWKRESSILNYWFCSPVDHFKRFAVGCFLIIFLLIVLITLILVTDKKSSEENKIKTKLIYPKNINRDKKGILSFIKKLPNKYYICSLVVLIILLFFFYPHTTKAKVKLPNFELDVRVLNNEVCNIYPEIPNFDELNGIDANLSEIKDDIKEIPIVILEY